MEDLYLSAGISRQAYSKWVNLPESKPISGDKQVVNLAKSVRKKYLPGSGVRSVYKYIRAIPELDSQLVGLGKHKFEQICHHHGLRIKAKQYIPKTTVHGGFKFLNKIESLIIHDINKIFVSDICYIFGAEGARIGFATAIIDIYSRYLLGLVFSKTMKSSDTVIPALKQTFAKRKIEEFDDTFFHSDPGRQYIQSGFIEMLRGKNIDSSMSRSCYENPFAEAFNDTLKNHMLIEYEFTNFKQLKRKEKFIKYVYNNNKIHTSIGGITPAEYELNLASIEMKDRIGLEIKTID